MVLSGLLFLGMILVTIYENILMIVKAYKAIFGKGQVTLIEKPENAKNNEKRLSISTEARELLQPRTPSSPLSMNKYRFKPQSKALKTMIDSKTPPGFKPNGLRLSAQLKPIEGLGYNQEGRATDTAAPFNTSNKASDKTPSIIQKKI